MASQAAAAGPLGAEGEPLRTSDYSVDLYRGPVMAGARLIGLSGAYTAIAEGVDGLGQNPAAAAVRPAWSVDRFDYDVGLGFTSASALRGNDLYNSGLPEGELQGGEGGLLFLTPALILQDGPWGYALNLSLQTFSLRRSASGGAGAGQSLEAEFAELTLSAAYAFGRGQLVLGTGLRSVALNVSRGASDGGERLFATIGVSPVIGALYKPTDQRIRLGASFKAPIETSAEPSAHITTTAEGDLVLGSVSAAESAVWLPRSLRQPWEATLGFAVSLGPRPVNPPFSHADELLSRERRLTAWRRRERARRFRAESNKPGQAEREAQRARDDALDEAALERALRALRAELRARARELARHYLLITTELQVTGSTSDSVGVESFVSQRVARAGEALTLSPRLGLEGEPIAHLLKLRAGSYLEPPRFRRSRARLHGTFGFDARLFEWTVFGLFDEGTAWRVGAAMDLSQRYSAFSTAVGVWR